jgi:hypothetical protein
LDDGALMERDSDSSEHPTLDFKSLQAAVDDVRHERGGRGPTANPESVAFEGTSRRDPLPARHPNFRWRLIPAVYFAFCALTFAGGVVTYDLSGNLAFAGYTRATISLAHALLLLCAALCWFRNYCKCSILLYVAVIVLNNLIY